MATEKIFKVKSVALEILKSNPPQLAIVARGETRTNGWTNGQLIPRFNPHHPTLDGVYEFDFVAEAPGGISARVISPIEANYIIPQIPGNLKEVVAYSETNSVRKSLANPVTAAVMDQAKRSATGFSERMNFDEAFHQAINNLPQFSAPYPDYMETIKVVEIGALFGGIAGISKMYVSIEAI